MTGPTGQAILNVRLELEREREEWIVTHLESKTGRTQKRDNRETRRQGERGRLGKEKETESE